MTITAKFASNCPKCRTQIAVGEKVEWTPGSKAAHVVCPMVVTAGECEHPVFHKQGCRCAVKINTGTDADDRSYDAWLEFEAQPKRLSVEDAGVYVLPNGDIVKIKANAAKTATYPMLWTEISGERLTEDDEHVDGDYVYLEDWQARRNLLNAVIETGRKMSLDEAKAFILRYGRCARCNRRLKAAKSVENGIGPVCIKYFSSAVSGADLMVGAA